jgi:LuxR family maltose regulon positive regulatory protein
MRDRWRPGSRTGHDIPGTFRPTGRASFGSLRTLPVSHVRRPRLTDFLNVPYQADLTLIVARAGTGKTSLALEWGVDARMPVAWCSLAPEDNDVARLAHRLLDALWGDIGPRDSPPIRLTAGDGAPERDVLLEEIASLEGEVTLVVDNCEVLSEPACVELFEAILALPDSLLKLMLISRAPLPLRLGRPRALGRVRELGLRELRFTPHEAAAVLRARVGPQVDQSAIDRVTGAAEGWAAGIVLLGIALRRATEFGVAESGDAPEDTAHLDEYVQQEILAPLPPMDREFVLATAGLRWLTPELCDVTLEAADGAGQLASVREHFPFLEPDASGPDRYGYQPLLRESLKRLARQATPAQTRNERHRRAAAWLIGASELEAAADLAIDSPGAGWAAEAIAPMCRWLAQRSDFDSLGHWFDRIPSNVVDASLDLSYWKVAAMLGHGHVHFVQPLVDGLLPRLAGAGDPVRSGRGLLVRGITAYASGDDDEAGTQLEAALAVLPEDAIVERMHAATWLSRSAFRQGRDQQADTASRVAEDSAAQLPMDEQWAWRAIAPERANRYALRGDLGSAITKYHLILSEIPPYLEAVGIDPFLRCRLVSLYIERNEVGAATREYELVEERMGGEPAAWQRDAIVANTRLLFALGRRDEAERWAADHLKTLRRMPEKPQLVHLLARIWLERGEFSLVESWLVDVEAIEYPQVQVFGDINHRMLAITLDLRRERYSDAASKAERMTRNAIASQRWAEAIPFSIRWAVALHQMGSTDRANAVLRVALEHGEPGGFVRAFTVPGFDTATMFRDVWSERQEYQAIRRALQEISGKSVQGDVTPISRRELEVLRLVAEGRSNQQIAAAMYISTNTVRNHLARISQRLHAQNRLEAVARARELGILE